MKEAYGSKIPYPQCEHLFGKYVELVLNNSGNVLRWRSSIGIGFSFGSAKSVYCNRYFLGLYKEHELDGSTPLCNLHLAALWIKALVQKEGNSLDSE